MRMNSYNIHYKLSVPIEEAYKVLRTNIQFYGSEEKLKTLAVTSCGPREGKTTTATNLAISMARTGIQVLLIDADLRKPMIVKDPANANSVGLSNYIMGYAPIDEIVSYTNIENLYFISCGVKPPNPAELIASKKFKEFLAVVEGQYDLIIIDTPPIGSVIDGALIAAQTDTTLLVVQSNGVDFSKAKRVKDQLEKVNAKILGVVLNKMGRGDYKSYYSHYDYYNRSGGRKKLRLPWGRKSEAIEKVEI